MLRCCRCFKLGLFALVFLEEPGATEWDDAGEHAERAYSYAGATHKACAGVQGMCVRLQGMAFHNRPENVHSTRTPQENKINLRSAGARKNVMAMRMTESFRRSRGVATRASRPKMPTSSLLDMAEWGAVAICCGPLCLKVFTQISVAL